MKSLNTYDPFRLTPPNRWLSSLFFKCLLGIMGIFIAATFVFSVYMGYTHYRAIKKEIIPASLETRLRAGLEQIGPDALAERAASDFGPELLKEMISTLLGRNNPVWMRYNRSVVFDQKMDLVLRFKRGGRVSQYSERNEPDLIALAEEVESQRSDGQANHLWIDSPDRDDWYSLVSLSIPDRPDQVLTLGVKLDKQFIGMMFPEFRAIWHMARHLAFISFMSSLVLALYLIRRIKKAERAATAWARGDLSVRINETERDEFGRLSQAFDHMADSLEKMMEVNQSLAIAEERNRLARDLHDTAKQRCFALGLRLSVLSHSLAGDEKQTAMIDSAIELTRLLQRDMTDVIQRFFWPTIARDGLLKASTETLNLLLNDSGIDWSLALTEAEAEMLESRPEWAGQLLLITTEAAANTLRHSQADRLEVKYRQNGDEGTWTVSDNGQGFDPETVTEQGMGLTNMRHRAESLPGGRLTVTSEPGRGTLLTITFIMTDGDGDENLDNAG